METQWPLLTIMVRMGLECSIKKTVGSFKTPWICRSCAWIFVKNFLNTWDYNKISSFCLKQQLAFSVGTIQCFLFKLCIISNCNFNRFSQVNFFSHLLSKQNHFWKNIACWWAQRWWWKLPSLVLFVTLFVCLNNLVSFCKSSCWCLFFGTWDNINFIINKRRPSSVLVF